MAAGRISQLRMRSLYIRSNAAVVVPQIWSSEESSVLLVTGVAVHLPHWGVVQSKTGRVRAVTALTRVASGDTASPNRERQTSLSYTQRITGNNRGGQVETGHDPLPP